MKTILLIFIGLLLVAPRKSTAQQGSQSIIGQVVSPSGEPVLFANVSLKLPESGELMGGAVTDEEGFFILPAVNEGEFFLSVSSMGYGTVDTEVFSVAKGQNLDFGKVSMEEVFSDLSEVTVQAAIR
ncbi:MAG: carboxypeptidase regulatory-like domain-containing protein [Limnospira maxima]